MAKRKPRRSPGAKIVVYSRISPDAVAGLDRIRASMRPKPTRAQLIDTAVAEYVERHDPGERKLNAGP